MAGKRRGQRAKSEMNVVPYIDVMLVLLVIFMISAPLLNQSVEVKLPNSDNAADVQPTDADAPVPLVVSIDSNGAYYVDRIDDNLLPVNKKLIIDITRKVLSENRQTPIYIRADKQVDYGSVMVVMDILKSAGADSVGLITAVEEEDEQTL